MPLFTGGIGRSTLQPPQKREVRMLRTYWLFFVAMGGVNALLLAVLFLR